jgi:hypothetical protein
LDGAGGGGRDPASGRFQIGNRAGRGRPDLRRAAALFAAVQRAARPRDVRAVLDKLRELALAGDVAAARAWLGRVVGREPDAPAPTPSAAAVDLPELRNADGCLEATARITAAVVAGSIDQQTARVLLDVVALRVRTIELVEHEQRIVELERAARAEGRRW